LKSLYFLKAFIFGSESNSKYLHESSFRCGYSENSSNQAFQTTSEGLSNLRSLKELTLIFDGFSLSINQHIHFFLDVALLEKRVCTPCIQ